MLFDGHVDQKCTVLTRARAKNRSVSVPGHRRKARLLRQDEARKNFQKVGFTPAVDRVGEALPPGKHPNFNSPFVVVKQILGLPERQPLQSSTPATQIH